MSLRDYRLDRQLHESSRSHVHRATRLDGVEVIVKTPAPHVSAREFDTRARHELLLCRMCASPGVIRALELVEGDAPALIFESVPGAQTLTERAVDRALSLRESIEIGLGILDALSALHDRNVVHKDIKPDNVLVTPELDRVVLIDLDIAAIVPRDQAVVSPSHRLEGTLRYMPPEQTGRVDRPIDYRSDYYGLGATLYWLLSGQAPFAELDDLRQLVHAQLARVPPRVGELNPAVPPALSRIVAKLLSKAADDRYQGGAGIRADLERCLAELDHQPDFEIATADRSERLSLPAQLYGREREQSQLAGAFLDLEAGPLVLVLRGPAGVGKTALLDSYRESLASEVIAARAQFEPVERGRPYAALGDALGTVISRLAQSDRLRQQATARIFARVGSSVSLVFGIIPELGPLLGLGSERDSGQDPGGSNHHERFWDTLAGVIDALFVPDRDFVLSFDDLQWADDASLRTLELLSTLPSRRLLVLVGLREGDRGEAGLSPGLRAWLAKREASESIRVGPLSTKATASLVRAALADAPGTEVLAELVALRSGGIPLHIAELLDAFYVGGAVDFDRGSNRWTIDLERARASELTVGTAAALARRFARLSPEARELLGYAACMGASFDPEVLMTIVGPEGLDEGLRELVAAGYVISESQAETSAGRVALRYRFAHDLLRRVALERATTPAAELHLSIARALGPGASDSELAVHACGARGLIVDPKERRRLGLACARTGSAALASAAFELALERLGLACELLDGDEDRASALELRCKLGLAFDALGKHEAAREAFVRARARVRDRREHLALLTGLTTLIVRRGDLDRARALAAEAADLFGLDLDLDTKHRALDPRVLALAERLAAHSDEDLSSEHRQADADYGALIELLARLCLPTYLAGGLELHACLACAVVEIQLDHGVHPASGLGLVHYALVQLGRGELELARRCAGIGLALIERFPESPRHPETQLVHAALVHPHLEPLVSSLAPLDDAYRQLRSAGSPLLAGFAIATRLTRELWVGAPLDQVIEEGEDALDYFATQAQPLASVEIEGALELAWLLADEAPDQAPDPPDALEGLDARARVAALTSVTTRAWAELMLGWTEPASQALARARPLRSALEGRLMGTLFDFVAAIAACSDPAERTPTGHRALADQVEASLAALRAWSRGCPANAEPFIQMLAGAWAELEGQAHAALDAYTRAADAALACGAANLEGFANHRAASLLLDQGRRRPAVGYLEDAYTAYSRWGAIALQRSIPERLRRRGHSGATLATLDSVTADDLDLGAALDSAAQMFEATTLEQVLERLLHATIENAGATRCLLLLDEEGSLRIRAEKRVTGELFLLDRGVALGGSGNLLVLSLVRICAGACAPIVVDDASRDPRFSVDPYVLTQGVRSLLAVPLMRQSQLIGVLYLENALTPGAFTPAHVGLLATLATQAAISIDNARLFDALRDRDEQWRAVVSGAPDTIMIVDTGRRIEFVNRFDFGFTPDLLIGQSATDIVTQQDRAEVERALDQVFESGQPTAYEVRIQTPEAGVRHWSTRVGPIMREGEVGRVTLISTDVTERHALEENLRHSQKMQAIGTLAGGIAHDFNNLLTVIMGAGELAELLTRDEEILELIAEINEAADQAAGLTQQLLAFSRRQVLETKRFDLRELVADLSRLLARVLGEPIELRLVTGETPCMILADRGQMAQVLVNLAVNARDAMPDGGVLTVATARIDEDAGPHIQLEVGDTGHGMESEVLERIFEPFFTTKPEGKGTGLGMATVLGIVGQSGGTIEVESAPGQGTSFVIKLPFARGDAETDEDTSAALPRGDETVLLVEDELAVQRVCARMLQLQGYRVHIAATGEQALALAAELDTLDLLLTDVVLPGLNGRDVAKTIQAQWPEAKVIYASGYTNEAVDQPGDVDKSAVYLAKPFGREVLALTVRAILDGSD